MIYVNMGFYVVMVCLIIFVNVRMVFMDFYVKMLIIVIIFFVLIMDCVEIIKKCLYVYV